MLNGRNFIQNCLSLISFFSMHFFFLCVVIQLSILSSFLFASVNMTNSGYDTAKTGFHGGVFYLTKKHSSVGKKVISQHSSADKALIYSPESDFIEIKVVNSLTAANTSNLSFSDVVNKHQD